jgi:hypothetical protein
MGYTFALFQSIWNNFFNPNGWLVGIENWLKMNNLKYDISKTLATTVFSYSAVAVGQSTVNIIPAGTSNPDAEHFMIQGISMFDGANATLNQTNWSLGISDALGKQGLLTITNAGTVELFQFPLRELIPATGDSGSGKYLLPKPIMWKGQTALSATITYATVPATANYNVGLDLLGLKLI